MQSTYVAQAPSKDRKKSPYIAPKFEYEKIATRGVVQVPALCRW